MIRGHCGGINLQEWGHRMLTDLQCRKAKAGEKDYKLSDAHGLYLFVTRTGFRSWRWKYRFAGKEKRLVLGSYPDMNLSAAREARENGARLLRSGIDPALQAKQLAAIRLEEAEATFETVAREWHGQQLGGWVPRHAADVIKSLEQDVFPKIGALPVKGITSPMVLEVIRAIEDRPSIETARRVRQRISAVYAYAIASGLADADPAAPIRAALKPLIKGRQPALATLEEARALLRQVEAAPAHPMTKLASRMLALTALRQGVLRTTMWSELEGLDLDEPVWRIPATRMKLKLDRKIDPRFDFMLPLSRQATEVLEAARSLCTPQPPCLSQPAPRTQANQRECGWLSLQSTGFPWASCASWLALDLLHHHERTGTGAGSGRRQGDHRPDAGAHSRGCRSELQPGCLYAATTRDRAGVGGPADEGHAAGHGAAGRSTPLRGGWAEGGAA